MLRSGKQECQEHRGRQATLPAAKVKVVRLDGGALRSPKCSSTTVPLTHQALKPTMPWYDPSSAFRDGESLAKKTGEGMCIFWNRPFA